MTTNNLVIFGSGPFAEIAYYYFTKDSPYSVVAFTVDSAYLAEPSFLGLPVVAFEELENWFPPTSVQLFVAMGIQKVNQLRAQKVHEVQRRGYNLVSYLSTKAKVAEDLIVRPNSFVMEEVYAQPKVVIGENSIIWPRCTIGFGSRIGSHCWLVAAILGESVVVGDYSFLGINSTVISSRLVGPSNVIGAGTVITENTKEFAVYKAPQSKLSPVPSHRLRRI